MGDSSETTIKPLQYIENHEQLWPNLHMRAEILKRLIRKNNVGAELGVHKGQFSRFILEVVKPTRLHLIDPWYLFDKAWLWASGEKSTTIALVNILKEFEAELVNKQVIVHIGFDQDVLKNFPDGYFDWVYLDTSHRYDQTLMELNLLAQKVKTDGVIAGDDWHEDPFHLHHGVCKAVSEFLEKNTSYSWLYCSDEDKQWAIAR